MTKRFGGFTIIELIFVIALLGIAVIIFSIQKNNVEILVRDNAKKTAINAMYYSLEEVFYPANNYYPRTIGADNLKLFDPTLFTDPSDTKINTTGSAYTYSPINCVAEKCAGYTLKSTLENEADYVKISRHN